MKTTAPRPRRVAVMLLACLALALPASLSLADACDPDSAELEVFEDLLIVFDPLLIDDEAAEIQAILDDPLLPELHAYDPPRHIPELSAWLLRTDPIAESRFEEIEDAVSLRVGVSEADDHWRFQTPEGVQRNLPDLTRSPTIDDFLFQPAATTIRALPSGRRWTGAGVTVAIIDTASSLTNPITEASMAGAGVDVIGGTDTADVPSNGIDDDGDGVTDESEQHGTFAAGLVHLAAPGARLLHLRVLDDDGHGDAWHVAQGIVDAVKAGADVINLSLGLTNELEILEVAVDWAIGERGVVIVAAAGNRASPCVDRPAANDGDGVIAVAAVTSDLQVASFTNYGREIALSAPGVDVISTHGEDLAFWSGTSFSTPLVAGGAAVLLEKYPELTPEEVKTLLQDTAQPYAAPAPDPDDMGAGVLDLGGVHARLLEPGGRCDTLRPRAR